MVIDGYFKLNKNTYNDCLIEESLGHKLISVEPDLVVDCFSQFPRLIIREDLVDIFYSATEQFVEAAYINSQGNKLFSSFLSTSRDNSTLITIGKKNNLPIFFYFENSLYIKDELISRINKDNRILDIEYRH
tara:strand:+ start:1256 stop:1651 length:396 start_codon:yes stop_codon:yes gene_type:complete